MSLSCFTLTWPRSVVQEISSHTQQSTRRTPNWGISEREVRNRTHHFGDSWPRTYCLCYIIPTTAETFRALHWLRSIT